MNESREIFSVKQLTRYIKDRIEFDDVLQNVWVQGELSNFVHHSRGHMYFTVKDEESKIKGVMFAGHNRYLKFLPKNGTRVLLRGSVSVYERDGQYQLYVKEMQPDGIGSLYLAYEQLKERLMKEGLFDSVHKRPLPAYPHTVGVITSPTGAAVRDIITTIQRRYPLARVLLFPVAVQGERAVPSICQAIEEMNARGDADVLIVGRGGGSIEELWAFNEEAVARSMYRSRIPIISAVGHETDVTIADFVADVRAATPTAAAELAVPHIDELRERVMGLTGRLGSALRGEVRQMRVRLEKVQRSYVLRQPARQLIQHEQRLDRLCERLTNAMVRTTERRRARLDRVQERLTAYSPAAAVRRNQDGVALLSARLVRAMQTCLHTREQQLDRSLAKLDALSPLKVMRRGYSLVFREDEKDAKLVTTIDGIQAGDALTVRLADGSLSCRVEGTEKRENT